MLEVVACVDKQELVKHCKNLKIPYSEALYLYVARDKDETLAAGLFEVESNGVRTLYYEAQDPADAWLFDAILRAGFHYASEHGITNGTIPETFRSEHRGLFSKLNFPAQATFDITNFFKKYKNCHSNSLP